MRIAVTGSIATDQLMVFPGRFADQLVSEQLARLDRAATRSLVDGATLLFTNQYEHDLLLKTAEWDEAQVLERVGAWVTTLGPRGVRIDRRDHAPVEVAAATGGAEIDPT